MSKKIVVILLGVGGLLAVLLFGVGLKLSIVFKHILEESLNNLAKHIHAMPFTCKGFKNIVCESAGIHGQTGAISLTLAEVKTNALQFKLDIPKLYATKTWMPTSAGCLLDLSLQDTLVEHNTCHLKGQQISYHLLLDARLKDGDKPLNLKNLLGSQAQTQNVKILVEKLGVKTYSKDFRSVLYPLLQKTGDIHTSHFDAQAYNKALEEVVRSFKGTVLVGLLVAGLQGEAQAAQELSNQLLAFAQNKRDHVSFELVNKNAPFIPLLDFIHGKNLLNYLPHFSIKVLP
ncbi:hypothetical protein [Helicobacter suis]|uniref:hypothetical protein n=1 Tax=Helicobacter suis TaxID=104628 RepID=UPI00248FC85D|nr:hypothetical protein [Helicobacter suis]